MATLLISANTSSAGAKTAKHYSKDIQSHNKESGLRTNHFVLLMLKRDWAYPEYEFKRKHVCDDEMKYSITRKGILIYYRNFVNISRWERQLVLKIRDFEMRKNNSNHWQAV